MESLKKQTVFENKKEIEVIVVDDGSDANTGFLTPMDIGVRNDIHPKLYRIGHQGAAAARNFGYAKSSGEFVFFCDSDVIFLKNYALEKMIKVLQKNQNKAYCYSSFKYGWKTFKCGEFDQEKLKQNNYISTMSMIRRSALEKVIKSIGWDPDFHQDDKRGNKPFDKTLKRFQDWDLWLSFLEQGETGIWLPEILWQAQVGGSMSKWLPKIFYKLLFLKQVKEFEKAKRIVQEKHHLSMSS